MFPLFMPLSESTFPHGNSLGDQEAQFQNHRNLLKKALSLVVPEREVIHLSDGLYREFESLNRIVRATRERLLNIEGMNKKVVDFFENQLQMFIALAEERLPLGTFLNSPQAVGEYLRCEIGWEEREVLFVFYLNGHHRLLKKHRLFEGTINRAMISAREIVKNALFCNASGVIVAHNHPSGSLQFSSSDFRATDELARALDLVQMTLVDHVLVTTNGFLSICESGWIGPGSISGN